MTAAPRPVEAGDAILGVRPRLALEPATVDEAAEAMRALAADRLAVTFMGGGTDLELGPPPARPRVGGRYRFRTPIHLNLTPTSAPASPERHRNPPECPGIYPDASGF